MQKYEASDFLVTLLDALSFAQLSPSLPNARTELNCHIF